MEKTHFRWRVAAPGGWWRERKGCDDIASVGFKGGRDVIASLPQDTADRAGQPYPMQLGQHAVLTLPRSLPVSPCPRAHLPPN